MPEGLGEVSMEATSEGVTAVVAGSALNLEDHSFAIVLVDNETNQPVSLSYGLRMQREANENGRITRVHMPFASEAVPREVRAYLMVGTYPAHRELLTIPR